MRKIVSYLICLTIFLSGLTAYADFDFSNLDIDELKNLKDQISASLIDKQNNSGEIVLDDFCDPYISALEDSWILLSTEIDSFEKYNKSLDKIRDFYAHVCDETQVLCIELRQLSINYAIQVISSDKSFSEKYDALDELFDSIYDDAGDDIFDKIYSGILDDMYDTFYCDLLDDGFDFLAYEEWADLRSAEYELWSDTRSDVYDIWADFRSDIYDFWSDTRSEILLKDSDEAKAVIADFQEDLNNLKDTLGFVYESKQDKVSADESVEEVPVESYSNGEIRPEFKEHVDSLEAFFDEYIKFLEDYSKSDNVVAMLADYATMMGRYAEAMAALDKLENSDMTEAEALYYAEASARISAKLLAADI